MEVYIRFDPNWRIGSDHKSLFYLETNHTNRWAIHFGANAIEVQGRINNVVTEVAYGLPGFDLARDLWNGNWHLLQWHLKMSDPGTTNGQFEAWIDGGKILEWLNINTFSPAGAYFHPIALSRNGDPLTAASMYFGLLKVYTTNPGW